MNCLAQHQIASGYIHACDITIEKKVMAYYHRLYDLKVNNIQNY